MQAEKRKNIMGWVAAGITILLSSFWAFWGIIENFHEGWYSTSVWENLFMLVFQYMSFTIIFTVLGLVALKWRKIGFALFVALGIFAAFFFSGSHWTVVGLLITVPLVGLGLLFFFGKPKPTKYAKLGIILVPLLVTVISGTPIAWRVSQRIDDGDYGTRVVEGNGITLVWAPKGPGWPDGGISWDEAQNCSLYLSENGTTLMTAPQGIWRVPTVDEMVRSQCLHGTHIEGVWDIDTQTASYDTNPDKETPLWELHSKVIYYWTGTEISADRAYMIVYDGGVFDKPKTNNYPYLSFRAVKDP